LNARFLGDLQGKKCMSFLKPIHYRRYVCFENKRGGGYVVLAGAKALSNVTSRE
jgi:hypothetical protein